MKYGFWDWKVSCPVNRLFENYEFSGWSIQTCQKADQDAIRSLGSKAQARFDTAVNQVARDVHRKVEDLHLPSYYRPSRGKKKKRKLDEVSSFGWAAWFIALGAEIFAISLGWVGSLVPWFDRGSSYFGLC